jgi:hypothetical protein
MTSCSINACLNREFRAVRFFVCGPLYGLVCLHISTCVPSSITLFNGNLKYFQLLLAFFSRNANRLSRQRLIQVRLVGITVSRLRK